MAGHNCDLCDRTPCGGLLVTFTTHTPFATWGKVCWACLRTQRDWPTSPATLMDWEQWVAQRRRTTSP
jgi:hypothetical protein